MSAAWCWLNEQENVMAEAKPGDTVKIHYTGKLGNGTVFDTSLQREPIEFEIGQQRVIPGFEQAVIGMSPGEKKETTIPSEEAYGPRQENMIVKLPKDQFPEGMNPAVGQQLQMQQADGRTFVVTVKEVAEEEVVVDANHPLAGEDLTFELELVEIA